MTHYEQYLKNTPKIQEAKKVIFEMLSAFDDTQQEVLRLDKEKFQYALNKYKERLVAQYCHVLRTKGLDKFKFVLIYFMYEYNFGDFSDIKEKNIWYSFLIKLGSQYCDIQWEDIDFDKLSSCDGEYYYEKKLKIDDAMRRNLELIITHQYIPQEDYDIIFEESEE